jgi:hypothetical protein
VQRTLKAQIENVLMRRGIDSQVLREPQLLDDKRADFLIRYGFIGPVILEIKLTSNSDVARRDFAKSPSFASMKRYMAGYGGSHGLFVAIANRDAGHVRRIKEAFRQLANVAVVTFVVRDPKEAPSSRWSDLDAPTRVCLVGPPNRRRGAVAQPPN